MTETVELFLALLAVLCQVFIVVTVALRLLAGSAPWARSAYETLAGTVGPLVLPFSFAVALVAMSGSLYFSEVADYIPCRLCWYQRIAIYPLVPILALALWRRDIGVRPYAILLALIDLPISLYHVVLERYPQLESSVCEPDNPCTLIWVEKFGYLTIPFMAGTAAATILTLMLLSRHSVPTDNQLQET